MKKRFSATVLTILLISPSAFAGVASPISDSMQHHNEMNGQHVSIGVSGKTSEVTKALNLTANDQMRFSLDTLDLQKGDTVSFTVTNTGQIHHEFVLGTREKIEMHRKEMQGMPNMKHADSNALSLKVRRNQNTNMEVYFRRKFFGSMYFAWTLRGRNDYKNSCRQQ